MAMVMTNRDHMRSPNPNVGNGITVKVTGPVAGDSENLKRSGWLQRLHEPYSRNLFVLCALCFR